MLKKAVHALGRAYISHLTSDAAQSQEFTRHNERSVEYGYVFKALSTYRPRSVLDVGSGDTALPSLIRSCGPVVTAIDNVRDYWRAGMVNRHWHVVDDDITSTSLIDRFDMITCVSVIEHIIDHVGAMRSMMSLLAPGGVLVITTPYSEMRHVSNVYELEGAAYGRDLPYTCRSTSRSVLDKWLDTVGGEIVDQEFWKIWSGDVWCQGDILDKPKKVEANIPHQLTCLAIRKS